MDDLYVILCVSVQGMPFGDSFTLLHISFTGLHSPNPPLATEMGVLKQNSLNIRKLHIVETSALISKAPDPVHSLGRHVQ